MDTKDLKGLMEAYSQVYAPQEELDEAEGSYGETPKAYSAASKTKMTAKRKPFLKAMQRRTNPANRKDAYDSPRKGMTASDREEARAGAAHGSPRGHDYPSQGPGGVTKNPKKLRKQKAMGEFAKEELDIFDVVLEFLQAEGYAETLEEAEWLMANVINEEAIGIILGEDAGIISGLAGLALGAKGATYAAKHSKRLRDYPKNFVKGMVDPRTYVSKKKKEQNEEFELWVNGLVEEGYDLSDYTWDDMYKFYLDEAIYSKKGLAKASEMIAKRSTPSGRAKSGKGANVAQIRQIRGSGRGDFDREGLGGTPMTPTMAKNPIKKQNYTGTGNKAARRAGLTPTREKPNAWKEEYMDEAQAARENPEKYEREQAKKSAPVRGERTPMPPRGDKRREDFEKWYAANVR